MEMDVCEEVADDASQVQDLAPRVLGMRGEQAAATYLEQQGYEVLERNWKCRFGEADIIALDYDGTLCFIEVKTRRSVVAGIPEEAVTKDKQRRYERIAMCYLINVDWQEQVPVRFDAIGICVNGASRALLRHSKGCFNGIY